jgi:two-component system chemotaxis response regulator CheY
MAERGEEVDLILSDVVMPRMGGIALLHALRDAGWETPVVLLTGHPLDNELESLRDFGVSDWLTKPPSLDLLGHTLAGALRR